MCREVDTRLRKLLCYRENAFWANIRKKIKFFKPFGLDPPPPLPRVTEQHPGYPLEWICKCTQVISISVWLSRVINSTYEVINILHDFPKYCRLKKKGVKEVSNQHISPVSKIWLSYLFWIQQQIWLSAIKPNNGLSIIWLLGGMFFLFLIFHLLKLTNNSSFQDYAYITAINHHLPLLQLSMRTRTNAGKCRFFFFLILLRDVICLIVYLLTTSHQVIDTMNDCHLTSYHHYHHITTVTCQHVATTPTTALTYTTSTYWHIQWWLCVPCILFYARYIVEKQIINLILPSSNLWIELE